MKRTRSRDSNSLELSEFFNNDDSEGYRLAEFLRKRRGDVQRKNVLFMNCEPLRLSLDVQLEKVPEKKPTDVEQVKEAEQPNSKSTRENVIEEHETEDRPNNGIVVDNRMDGDNSGTDAPPLQSTTTRGSKGSRPASPVQHARGFSPRLSAALRKSGGGYSPGDRLRRYSLNRLSRLCSGKRALLQEFESTISDSGFVPNVCSTPLSQENTKNKVDSATNGDENIVPNVTVAEENEKSVNQGTHCCNHSKALQQASNKTDEQLRSVVESILETTLKRSQSKEKKDLANTNLSFEISPARERGTPCSLKRTYTLEKGEKPGQVVLTPEVPLAKQINDDLQNSHVRHNDTYGSPKTIGNISRRLSRRSQISVRNTSLHAAPSKFREASTGDMDVSSRSEAHNVSIVYGSPKTIGNISSRLSRRSPNSTRNTNLHAAPSTFRESSAVDMDISTRSKAHNESIDLVERSRCHSPIQSPKSLTTTVIATSRTNTRPSDITITPRKNQYSPINNMKTPERNTTNRSQITIMIDSPRVAHSPHFDKTVKRSFNDSKLHVTSGRGITTEKSQYAGQLSPQYPPSPCAMENGPEIPNTQQGNISIACPGNDEDMMVPETQEIETNVDKCITIQSNANVLVIPVRQTFNTTLRDTENAVGCEANATCSSARPKMSMEHIDAATDNLKLTDIMTDDEEPNTNSKSISSTGNNSHVPLNLVASNSNIRTKRLRKRSLSRRRLQMDHSQVMSTETETEHPPLAHSNDAANRKRNLRKKLIPLNKAPGTPLNGEKFAKELARMSNYEILDLRKRNSMGRVFALSKRKSTKLKEEVIKKQIQLDDQIELELIRRNMEATEVDAHQCMETNEMVDPEICPPVPDEFRDVLPMGSDAGVSSNSLIDEKSCDRVSFRTRKASTGQKQVRKKKMPEVLQHYLEISNRYSQKQRSFQMDKSKPRLLYTQGFSDSKEQTLNTSIEKNAIDKETKRSLPYVPSPPRSDLDNMPPLRVVSPPPPLETQFTDSQSTDFEPSLQNLPPPPQQFESDSGFDSNRATTEENTYIQNQRDVLATDVSTSTDGDVFKKPTLPPPKRKKSRKVKPEIESESGIVTSSDELAASDGTLRRSKRGHVPLKHAAPLFQLLFQQVLNKAERQRDKKIVNDKIKLRESSKATLGDNSSVSSAKTSSSSSSASSRKRRGPLATVPKHDALPLKGQTSKPKRNPKTKSEKSKQKEKSTQNDEALECSRIKMTEPPPLDHFNNVFDQLRNTSVEITAENKRKKPETHFKERKLKVRVARLKESRELNVCHEEQRDTGSPSPSNETALSVSSNNHSKPADSPSISSSGVSNHSNFELISWLKNITEAENTSRNDEIFKEMRISSASNLCFTELQGVEYAFYDTEDKASLGYLRFKPRQIKPKKRAKRYHLHFVTLVGNFRITANDKESKVGPGDMVAIEKSVYYDIENLSDDIGILMVIKK